MPVNTDRPKALPLFLDTKFNVVMYGISEGPQNIYRQIHQQTDLDNILEVFSKTEVDIEYSSVKYFFILENLIKSVIPNTLIQF